MDNNIAKLFVLNKQAVLVETLNGLETVNATGSGKLMRKRYEEALNSQAESGNKIRTLSQFIINFAGSVQQYAQVAAIFLGGDGSRADPLPETRPAGAGIEFGVGTEQGDVTADAVIHTAILEIPVSASEGPFRASPASHLELFRSQLLTPLLRGAFNTIAAGS